MQAFRGISFDFLSLSRAQPLLPAPALAHAQPRACRLPAAGHLFLLKLNHCRRKDLTLSPPPSGSPCLLEETVNTKPHPEQNNTWASPHPRLPQHRFPRAISQHKPQPAHTAGGRWGFQPPETKRIKKKKKISWEMCCKQAKSRGNPVFALNGKGACKRAGSRAPAMERDGTKPGRRGGD